MIYSWWLKSSEHLLVRKWDWDHSSHLSLSKSIKIITLMCWWPLMFLLYPENRKGQGPITDVIGQGDDLSPEDPTRWEGGRLVEGVYLPSGFILGATCVWRIVLFDCQRVNYQDPPGRSSSLTQKSDACFVDRMCCKISPIFLYCEIFLPRDRLMISVGLNPESFSPALWDRDTILCRWNNYPSALTCHLVISTTHTHTCCVIQRDSHDEHIRCFTYWLLGWNPPEWSRSYFIFSLVVKVCIFTGR